MKARSIFGSKDEIVFPCANETLDFRFVLFIDNQYSILNYILFDLVKMMECSTFAKK